MTKHTQLNAEIRTVLGNSVRKLRNQGILPAVIYSKDLGSISLQLNYLQFLKAFKEAGTSHVVDLLIDSKKYPCLVHDLDIHPVTGKLRHVDFLSVNLKNKVTATVELKFIGESPAVKEFGAVLATPLLEIEVEALPDNLPSEIEINLANLVTLDDVIRVSDLPAASDYVIMTSPEEVIATLVYQSEEKEEEEVAPVEEVAAVDTNTNI
jgi:large subunit ribosomal protein L25